LKARVSLEANGVPFISVEILRSKETTLEVWDPVCLNLDDEGLAIISCDSVSHSASTPDTQARSYSIQGSSCVGFIKVIEVFSIGT
jgi:hypothetical protein